MQHDFPHLATIRPEWISIELASFGYAHCVSLTTVSFFKLLAPIFEHEPAMNVSAIKKYSIPC